jgi:hypothetical protein
MVRTLEEIRQRGLSALRKELGRAGMIRFLQQFENGSGDYARERHAWVDRVSLDELLSAAGNKGTRKK